MTQYFDFVALGWIEKYLRDEMAQALRCLKKYDHAPQETQHLREALRNAHSASGVLRLCALDPAAMLTEEIERVISMLAAGTVTGESRKLAMTELVAAFEALPAYLANVRAKREVSAGVIANVINDLRHFSNRPALPDSLFFNPPLKPSAGVSAGKATASSEKLKQFSTRAVPICFKYAKPALKREHDALKRMYAIGKHAVPLLAGSQMEPYFRCYMGLIEALAQHSTTADEVIVDIFKHSFGFLKSMARNGLEAVDDASPAPYIKKMLYYIAKSPAPTDLQLSLRDTFDIHDVDGVRIESSGRLIQEDDLLDALRHTLSQLLEVMEFITSEHREICATNTPLHSTIVPRMRQVSLQLKAIGLTTHADTIFNQYEALQTLSLREQPASQADLLDFGGAVVAVKESLEHKLKHGLSAQGDSVDFDLDAAVMAQTARCLTDMKNSINREFSRGELIQLVEDLQSDEKICLTQIRPLYRAATLLADEEMQRTIVGWEQGKWPQREVLLGYTESLLEQIPEHSYAEQAALDMEQVLSVLALMEGKLTESAILDKCASFIRESIAQGGLINDSAMACFAEAIAALEQYMERRIADPLGNADEHLDRAEARARMLASFSEQRSRPSSASDNILEFDAVQGEDSVPDQLDLSEDQAPAAATENSNVVALVPGGADKTDETGIPWGDALTAWGEEEIDRDANAPLENPEADVDEELVDIFVDEARKYIRRLEDAQPTYESDPGNEKAIMEIRAIFHTLKGSARTIELMEFGEFMFDMEKVFNAQRDGYIKGTAEIAELCAVVTSRMPELIEKMLERVPLYTSDFSVPHSIAKAISEKKFKADSTRVGDDLAPVPAAAAAAEPKQAEHNELADEASPESQEEPIDETQLWAQQGAADILASVLAKLQPTDGASDETDSDTGRASMLVQALVPALVELRDGEFLSLEDSTLGYFLDLPVIEQLANNAVFGLDDNGQGEYFQFPLSKQVITDLHSYLDLLPASNDDREEVVIAHDLVKAFVREALSLPELEPMEAAPVDNISSEQLNRHAKGEVEPFRDQPSGSADSEAETETETETEDDTQAQQRTGSATAPEREAGQEQGSAAEREIASAPEITVAAQPYPKERQLKEQEFFLIPEGEDGEGGTGEDLDSELLELFIETLDEYLEGIDVAVGLLDNGDETGLWQLKNTLHTIKGAANSVGVSNFGGLVHDFEGLLADLEHAGAIGAEEIQGQIYPRVDELQEAARFVRRRGRDWDAGTAAADAEAAAQVTEEPAEFNAVSLNAAVATEELETKKQAISLRVSTSKVDRLLDTGLEISMTNVRGRHALESALQDRTEVQGLARRVHDLVDKLSLQLDTEIQAKTETVSDSEAFDPLEMDRITEKQSLAAILREAAFDLHEQSLELGEYIDTAMRESGRLARLIEGNQSEMRLLRLVNFSKLGPGFRRLVHQVSRKLEKQVEFEITCDEGGLDVGVFGQVKTALEHMLRNSVDHGIDTPAERAKLGKSETGKVSLVIYRQASEFVIQLLDDGKGLDPQKLRDKALMLGLMNASDELSEREALRLIFLPGFSTAAEVTDVSGRGVGMDVVHQSITQVGGSIEVQSKPGFYTQFDIRIPASIMVNGALLALIGSEEVAIPLTSLEGSDFLRRDEILMAEKRKNPTINYRDEEYQLRYLGVVRGTLPPPKVEAMSEFVPVLYAQYERRRVAFYVDSVANAEEMVIRSLGAQYTGVPGVAGGSLKPDGQPVLALDLNELIQQVDYADEHYLKAEPEVDTTTLILCVDDSVMMRRTYEKRLQSLGYEVVTAVDGEEALDYLSDATRLPDFIFTDLEMPNMNGFDFIANLRRAPVLEGIPTVVVSSRDGEKHRSEARRVGATDFMAKGANSAEGMRAVIERHLNPPALAS